MTSILLLLLEKRWINGKKMVTIFHQNIKHFGNYIQGAIQMTEYIVPEEIGKLRMEIEGFAFDLIYLSNGMRIITEEDLKRFTEMLNKGELSSEQVERIKKVM